MKYKLNKRLTGGFISATILTVLICWACGFEWKSSNNIIYKSYSVEAGQDADFEIRFNVMTNESYTDKLIFAIQVPKVWNPREAGNVVVTFENLTTDAGVIQQTELVPEGTSPVKQTGITWEQHLQNRFGDQDPNVLDDMQWVTFVSKNNFNLNNKTWEYTAKVRVKTGEQNLRAKIGFCVYHEKEGGADNSYGSSTYVHYIVDWGECFEVTGGEGDIIDFCELHFNQQTPGMANQNDILTLRYIGDIATNDLMDANEVYLTVVGTTTSGVKHAITEKSEKTKLLKESVYGLTYSKTFWPEDYFNLTAGETLATLEYYFTNKDGDKYVSLYDDQYKKEPEENPTWTEKPIIPFMFTFQK